MTGVAIRTSKIGEHAYRADTWNPARDAGGQHIRHIDLSSVDNEQKRVAGHQNILAEEAPSRARQLVRAGDILVSTVRPNLNGVACVPAKLDGATASTGFCVLRPDPRRIVPEYLFHWVKSPAFVDEMIRKATGASYPAVSDKIIFESEIPLPPIEEQRRIAAILDQADLLRRKRRQSLTLLEDLIESSCQETLVKWAPMNREMMTIGDICDVQGGLQVSGARKAAPIEVPYLRVANVYRNRLWLDEVKTLKATESEISRTSLKKADILVVEGHGNAEEIGRAAIWDGSIEGCVHQNHLIRMRVTADQMEPHFICRYLNSIEGRKHLLSRGKTTSGLNTISVSDVRETRVPNMPAPLQREFVAKIAAIGQAKKLHETHLVRLDALFVSLQHRAFRGEFSKP